MGVAHGPGVAEIRGARAEDVPAIVALLADDELGRQREHFDGPPLPPGYLEAFAAIDADPAHLLLVAEIEGRVVATLQLTFLQHLTFGGGLRAQIEAVRVVRDLRGHGVGQATVTWAIERARERGAHLVQLTTDARRPDARRFYERLGFEATHVGMKLRLEH